VIVFERTRGGMSPTHYRSGGVQEVLTFAVGQCSLGAILVALSARGVAAILRGDDPDTLVRELEGRFPRARLVGGDTAYEQLVAQVVGLVEAPAHGLALPLDVRGTAFQQRVWRALRDVPFAAAELTADDAVRPHPRPEPVGRVRPLSGRPANFRLDRSRAGLDSVSGSQLRVLSRDPTRLRGCHWQAGCV
jgi:hypothetical protein